MAVSQLPVLIGPADLPAMRVGCASTGVMGRRTERWWQQRWWRARSYGLPPPAGTFHSVAGQMLRSHLHRLPDCGRTRDFNIHDKEDNVSMLMDWVRESRKARSGQLGEDIKMKVLALFHISAPRAS